MWLLVTASNIVSIVSAYRNRGTTSLTLFIGGIFGVIAVLVCPLKGTWVWFWVPLLLDPGSLPALARIILTAYQKKSGAKHAPDK